MLSKGLILIIYTMIYITLVLGIFTTLSMEIGIFSLTIGWLIGSFIIVTTNGDNK